MKHKLLSIVDDTVTNSEGFRLLSFLENFIQVNKIVEVSFEGVDALSSSFLNSSIGELIYKYEFDKFKKHVKFVDLKQSVADQIRKYLNSCNVLV